ncbi:MAG: hypothetical protein ABMA14_26605 [Hyphomonadaceae bacterium]
MDEMMHFRRIARFVPNAIARAFVLALPLLLSACWFFGGHPAGEGPKAEAGFVQGQKIIDALEQWRKTHTQLPETLALLSSNFLIGPTDASKPYDFRYTRTGEQFTLEFSYEENGINFCTYIGGSGWHCAGYV